MDRGITVSNSLTIPNAVTIGRLIVAMGGVLLMRTSGDSLVKAIIGLFLFSVIGMGGDWLDGWLARRFGWVSRLGQILDPLADKIIFYSPIFIIFYQFIFLPIFVVMLVCDAISTWMHITTEGGAVGSGKNKFGAQCIALGFFCVVWFAMKKFVVISGWGIEACVLVANITIGVALILAFKSLKQRLQK